MKRKLLLLATALGICTCVLMACHSKPAFSAGKELSAEELEALRASLQEKDPDAEGLLNAEKTPSELPNGQAPSADDGFDENKTVFYYTESGEVYHSDRECSYLKKSTDVKEGTALQVEQAGKTRLCSACAKKAEGEKSPENESGGSEGQTSGSDSENGENKTVFYYTVSGETYHLDRNCTYLKSSNAVNEGTAADALAAGKIHPCSRCGD